MMPEIVSRGLAYGILLGLAVPVVIWTVTIVRRLEQRRLERQGRSRRAQPLETIIQDDAQGFVSVHPETGKKVWITPLHARALARNFLHFDVENWMTWRPEDQVCYTNRKKAWRELYAYAYQEQPEPSPFVVAILGLDNGGVSRGRNKSEKLLHPDPDWPELPWWAEDNLERLGSPSWPA